MPAPRVSVVIPTYNQPKLLAETLDSVFAQTFTDYEVIVVNDGSTDETEAYLQSLGTKIRLITQENQGIGAARNRGIAEARGDLVALLDHDDIWKPQKLEVQVAFLEKHPSCVAASVPYSYSTSPQRCVFDLSMCDAQGIVKDPLMEYASGSSFIISSALIFNRRKAAGLQYETRRQCVEDMPFQFKLLARGPFGIAGDEIQMVYRMHASNQSASATYYYNGLKRLREMQSAGEFEPLDERGRRALDEFLAYVGRMTAARQLAAGLRSQGLRTYVREFRHQLARGRFRFLSLYPGTALLPRSLIRRIWRGNITN